MKENKDYNVDNIIKKLKSLSNPEALKGMARYGISIENTFGGISTSVLRAIARETGRDNQLAQKLWETGIHEARILAGMVSEPEKVTEKQLEDWVSDFDSWDVCDEVIMNLFEKMPVAYRKAVEWSSRKEEFVKRAGFALMARLAVSDKKAPDEKFTSFFPYIKKESTDGRNYVKKAVNWALRQIGKRNISLNKLAIEVGEEIYELDSKSARWIASDALRELKDEKVKRRLIDKENRNK